jgi:hypothetical protein
VYLLHAYIHYLLSTTRASTARVYLLHACIYYTRVPRMQPVSRRPAPTSHVQAQCNEGRRGSTRHPSGNVGRWGEGHAPVTQRVGHWYLCPCLYRCFSQFRHRKREIGRHRATCTRCSRAWFTPIRVSVARPGSGSVVACTRLGGGHGAWMQRDPTRHRRLTGGETLDGGRARCLSLPKAFFAPASIAISLNFSVPSYLSSPAFLISLLRRLCSGFFWPGACRAKTFTPFSESPQTLKKE